MEFMAKNEYYPDTFSTIGKLLGASAANIQLLAQRKLLEPIALTPNGAKLYDYFEAFEAAKQHNTLPGRFDTLTIVKRRLKKGFIKTDKEVKREIARREKDRYPLTKYVQPEIDEWLLENRKDRKKFKNLNGTQKTLNVNSTAEAVLEGDRFVASDLFEMDKTKKVAETEKTFYLAKKAKIDFLKTSAMLTETDLIGDMWFVISTIVTKNILAIPDRVCAQYASRQDKVWIREDLKRELVNSLSKFQFSIEEVQKEIQEDLDANTNKTQKAHKLKSKKT